CDHIATSVQTAISERFALRRPSIFGVPTFLLRSRYLARRGMRWPGLSASFRRPPSRMADNLTPEQRSYCMSRVKRRDTGLERTIQSLLRKRRLRFRKQMRTLRGRPDIAFPEARGAVFIDGACGHRSWITPWT